MLSLLEPDVAELLRLGAIPHVVDRTAAAILMPELSGEGLDRAVAELLELSFVRSDGSAGSLHDEARRYLLAQWIESRDTDPERWRRFPRGQRPARRPLRQAGRRGRGRGAQRGLSSRRGGRARGVLAVFRQRFAAARLAFRLEACEALVTIIADLDPLLDDTDRAWLRYAQGKAARRPATLRPGAEHARSAARMTR